MNQLDLYVARAKLPISVRYNEKLHVWEINSPADGGCATQYGDKATAVYLRHCAKLLAAYLPPAPERGQITDQVV